MAESQDNRPKPKKPEENDDRPTTATSQDSKTYVSDYPNTEKQREGNKSNKVQHKKDCDDGNSSQAESEKTKGNNDMKTKINHEKIEKLESGEKENTVEKSKVEMESTKRKPGSDELKEVGKLKNTSTALEQDNTSKVHCAAVKGNSRQEPPASQSKKVRNTWHSADSLRINYILDMVKLCCMNIQTTGLNQSVLSIYMLLLLILHDDLL